MKTIHLESYLRKIGYSGPKSADIDVLKTLQYLHPKSFPFENLNPFLGIPVKLDLESLQEKMIKEKRGGYCFEQNLLFKAVLEELGFSVRGLAARILWNQPTGQVTSRGHMLLLVELDHQKYIADVGFGGLTLTAPLQLQTDQEQQTPHEQFRLQEKGKQEYIMQAKVKKEWKSIYSFDLQEQFLPDYEITNWYLSNHPESHFVTGLIAARAENDRRLALQNNRFSVHHLNGVSETHYAETVAELRSILQNRFFIDVNAASGLDEKLEELLTQQAVDT